MAKRLTKLSNLNKKLYKLTFITVFIIISLSNTSIPLSDNKLIRESPLDVPDNPIINLQSSDLFENDVLYTGIQDALVINETALYTSNEHYEIGNGTHAGITSQNAEFPIDTTHDWEGFFYNATISNIQDERDWVENGGIGSNTGLTYGSQTVQTYESTHDYGSNLNDNSYISTIDGSGCDYMRLHFVRLEIEYYYDVLYIKDQTNTVLDTFGGIYSDFYTPWYAASTLKVSIDSDGSVEYYGFEIDFFETYDGSMFTIDSTNWSYFEDTITDASRLYGGTAEQGNHSALGVVIEGIDNAPSYEYEDGDIAGFYQDLSIPRGQVIDAWVSMDYNLLRGIETNDNYAFIKLNGETVYTRGFRTITEAGLGKWHSTGNINLALWENSSNIFNNVVNGQSLNISVGIEIGNGVEYTGFDHLDIQEVYLDNIQLILRTSANASQTNINIDFNGISISDSASEWGSASFSRYGSWDTNPMQILMTTDGEKLDFDLYSEVYGYHTDSTHEQSNEVSGTKVTIYTNESVQWESYHNVFVPSQYSDFSYNIFKPTDWNVTHVEDPTGLPYLSYLDGDVGDSSFTIESDFPGWWYFVASSNSRLLSSSTDLWDDSTWKDYDSGDVSYDIGDNIRIRTALSNPSQIGNILSSTANITVYHPNETVYFTDDVNPDGSGNVQFADYGVTAADTVGGMYQYKIIWTNGTSAGGLNGTFEIKHSVQHTILYPRDAITDLETESVSGDVIPVRVILNDTDTGVMLSGLKVEYNWTSGNGTLNEISSGIYDTSLDTLDLGGSGDYEIEFTISGEGFYNLYFTLTIHLVAETELKIIQLDNNIDYGTNFTMRLDFQEKLLPVGINNATISLNLTEYHVSEDVADGEYTIEINSGTSFTGSGTWDIEINATHYGHISQELVTRIQILPRSVYFQILINSSDCTLNKSYSAKVYQDFNFTVGVYTTAEDIPVTTGTVQLSYGETLTPEFTEENDQYFRLIDSSFFGLGAQFVSIIFNETGYQSASETLLLTITPISIEFDIQINDSNCNANKSYSTEIQQDLNFSIGVISVEDSSTITSGNVQISVGTWTSVPFTVVNERFNLLISTTQLEIGVHFLTLIFNETGYQTTTDIIQITITPISVAFDITINSADCNLNKSYSTEIRDIIQFSIGVETTDGSIPVSEGSVQISLGSWISDPFILDSGRFIGTVNTSDFGTGVHFINVIFNGTGYQSESEIIQISLLPIVINTEFEDTDTQFVTKKDEFTTRIYLEDPTTLEPLVGATVTYKWDYGTGTVDEVGDGWYEFTDIAPNRPGSYHIQITITTDDSDFEPITMTMTLISQQPDTSIQWWWFVAGAGVLVTALSGTLIAIGVKNKRKKRHKEEIAKLKQKTQIFDDITNIKGILLIEKNSGLLMYKHVISGLDEENEELFSGFIRAILLLGKRFIRDDDELEKGMVFEKQEFIEFAHENFKVLLAGGHKIIVAIILEEQASEVIKVKVSKFIEEFEGIYASVLDNWTGNRSVFADTTPKLFEEIFNLSLLKAFHLSENSEIYAKKLITPNSISDEVSKVINTLHEEKETFYLKTLISLVPEANKLVAKDVILKFIKGKYIVPKK